MYRCYGKNPELRRYLVAQAAVGVATAAIAAIGIWVCVQALHRDLALRALSAANAVAREYPEAGHALSRELARAYGSRVAPVPDFQGADAASGSGPVGSADLLRKQPGVTALSAGMALVMAVSLTLLLGSSLWLPYRVARGLYDRVRAVAIAADKVGLEPRAELDETDRPGDVGQMAQSFNRMARRVSAVFERLGRERAGLEDLITDVSHQLKTPLSSIKLMVELVHEGRARGEQAEEFLLRTLREVDRMEWLIRSLLGLARAESGALRYRILDGDLQETVESALDRVRVLAASRGVVVRQVGLAGRLPHDGHWLGEALGNLAKNCVEHSPAGAVVTVESTETPALVRITVSDRGSGIPQADIPRLFTRFYRGPGETQTGAGVGLALARAVVEAHDGSIRIHSEPQVGTTFTVLLPRKVAQP